MTIRTFHRPTAIEEALELLERFGEDARIVAGSTAVTIMLRQGLIDPEVLVAIDRLPNLSGIELFDDRLEVGALVTHRRMELDAVVRSACPVVASTFGKVASTRIRNVATVGGVLAEADYASDPPALLLLLDAIVHATGPSGQRDIPIADFFVGFYETALEPGEILTGLAIPRLPDGTGTVYEKFVTRSSEDRPCIGVAAAVSLHADGTCSEVRVAVGAATEVPVRFRDLEAEVKGSDPLAAATALAGRYAERIDPLDDLRGSAWYRREMARVWIKRAVLSAVAMSPTNS